MPMFFLMKAVCDHCGKEENYEVEPIMFFSHDRALRGKPLPVGWIWARGGQECWCISCRLQAGFAEDKKK